MAEIQTKVILVGLGGATCSGKTTLAKHLKNILPNSVIVHQDDFAPPEELLPIKHGYQDWDAPDCAIDYPRLSKFLKHVKDIGSLPDDHRSHDHLNKQTDLPIEAECQRRLAERFRVIQDQVKESDHVNIVWGLIDGFLLYWNQEVIDQLDVRFLLRVPLNTLEGRRKARQVYITAKGDAWVDPPDYWEKIVLPAYLDAHREIFEDGDVENGGLTNKVKGLVLIEPEREDKEMSMTDIVERCCQELYQFVMAEGSNK
jgi:nicotinamide/nicotinate riboside kinase